MRRLILAIGIYLAVAFSPPFPVTKAEASPIVSPQSARGHTAARSIPRRKKRRRHRPIVYRKPLTVYVTPDVVQVLTIQEWEREQAARRFAAMVWRWL
jgi:hypothetical protein